MARFECSMCGVSYDVDDSLAEKAIRCNRCKEPGRVSRAKFQPPPAPAPSTPPPPPAAPAPGSGPSVQSRPPANLWDPWYLTFADNAADMALVFGGIGCVLGFILTTVMATDNIPSDRKVLATIILLLTYGLLFVGLVFAVAMIKVSVDAARSLRRLVEQSQHRP